MTRSELLELIHLAHLGACACEALYEGRESLSNFAMQREYRYRFLDVAYARCAVLMAADVTILVVCGTNDGHDWVTNLSADQRYFGGLRVHRGFAESAELLAKQINSNAVAQRYVWNDEIPLVIVGHSSGGAVAELLAINYSADRLITYGAPRVFASRDAAAAAAMPWETARFVLGKDPVPRLPLRRFRWMFGGVSYAHSSDATHLDHSGQLTLERSITQQLANVWQSFVGWWLFGIVAAIRNQFPSCLADHSITAYRKALENSLQLYGDGDAINRSAD